MRIKVEKAAFAQRHFERFHDDKDGTMNYENLFTPGYIGGLRIKNRVVMTAMGNGLAAENGEASDEIIACYKARAAGGCGLLITEFCAVDGENGIAETHQLQIHAPRFIKRLALLTDTLHRYDCKVFFQLFHPGREGKPQFNGGRQVISASGIVNPATGRVSHEMTREEIHGMVNKFVTGAVYAQQANADGVELHCAHGYLLHQFLSPHSNVRTDEYGGCLENRMRIVREIIEGIHCACGRDFPISVRINGCDYIPEGLQKADAVEIAKLLEHYGVSCINVSSGGYENPAAFIEPCYFPEGWKRRTRWPSRRRCRSRSSRSMSSSIPRPPRHCCARVCAILPVCPGHSSPIRTGSARRAADRSRSCASASAA